MRLRFHFDIDRSISPVKLTICLGLSKTVMNEFDLAAGRRGNQLRTIVWRLYITCLASSYHLQYKLTKQNKSTPTRAWTNCMTIWGHTKAATNSHCVHWDGGGHKYIMVTHQWSLSCHTNISWSHTSDPYLVTHSFWWWRVNAIHALHLYCPMNNYIVRSFRDVIVITKFATRRASKAQSIYSHVLKQKTY